jgi:hypothetical protein
VNGEKPERRTQLALLDHARMPEQLVEHCPVSLRRAVGPRSEGLVVLMMPLVLVCFSRRGLPGAADGPY